MKKAKKQWMKKLVSLLLSSAMVFTLTTSALALDFAQSSSTTDASENRISRENLDKIRNSAPVLTEAQSQAAITLLNEKVQIEQLSISAHAENQQPLRHNQERLNSIDAQLDAMGVIPLSIEDLYTMTGRVYRPGAPDVPGDSNYVHFYGMTTYIGDYEVWSIVASSTGYDQSVLAVPFYTDGTAVIYNQDAYFKEDFRKYIDMGTSLASKKFDKAFEKLPVLNYIGTAWDIATFLNPTSTQKITVDYDANQVFIFSYVAKSSVGYFDFMLSAERKQGTCVLISRHFNGGNSQVKELASGEFEALAAHYADYQYAVDLYRNGMMRTASYVGDIQFKLDNKVVAKISMPTYSELWSIPGI